MSDMLPLQVMRRAGKSIFEPLARSFVVSVKPASIAGFIFIFLLSSLPFPTHASQASPLLQTYLYDVADSSDRSTVNGLAGSFSYSVPIKIPPGRNGLQPELSFSYNNQNTQKLNTVGYGWGISIPYIERENKRGIDSLYSSNDFYSSLSGELATTTNASIFYPTSDDGSYLQYAFASSTNQWTVTDKKGTVYKFGYASSTQEVNPSDSSKVFRWMLQEVRDTNDNYVSYSYFKDQGFLYPSQIAYTGHGSTDGAFTVDFGHESRSDIASSTAPGFEIASKYRINQVTVSVDGTWVRKYDLAYGTGDNGVRSTLSSITESGQSFDTGSSVTASLPATSFSYQSSSSYGWATTTSSFSLPLSFRETYDDTGLRVVDYNGDSLPDLIRAKTGTTTQMYANTGSAWSLQASSTFPVNFVDSTGLDQGVRLADVNGDGLIDILQSNGLTSTSYLNTGSGFATSTVWTPPVAFTDATYGADAGVRLADVNGDGLVDILYSDWYPQYGYGYQTVYLNNGAGWTASAWTLPLEFLNIWNASGTLVKVTPGVDIEDVNGDGLVDLVAKDANPGDQKNSAQGVFLNTGSGWSLASSWTIPHILATSGNDEGARLIDVNGDGLVDFVDGSSSGSQNVYLNTGSNWVLNSSWKIPTILQSTNGYAMQISDVNGDGLPDFVQKNGSVHNRYINQGKYVDTLTHVNESTGSSLNTAYQSSANSTLNPRLPFLLQTVKSIQTNNGLNNLATTTYAYQDGSYYFGSPFNRTYAGFGMVTKTDPTGNVTKTYYQQGNTSATSTGEFDDQSSKIGKSYRTEIYDNASHLFNLLINTWDRFTRGTNADFVYNATSTSFTYDGNSDHRDTAESYAFSTSTGSVLQKINWGEVTGSTNGSFTDTGSDKFTTAYSYAASSTSNLILPSDETTTNQSSTKVKEIRSYYDTLSLGSIGLGNLTKQEFWSDGSNYVNSQKTYNSYGLVTRDTDPRGKFTDYSYDAFNLYAATTTDALSHVTGRSYDYSSGKVNQTIDPNGFVFKTLFDPFDRPIEEKQPDLSSPSTLVTRSTYSYTDTSMPRLVLKTDYLNSATSTDMYTYQDGFGKTMETRTEAEGSNFTINDFTYDARGLLSTESLPFFGTGTGYTATSSPAASSLLTTYTYDPLQRVLAATNVVGVTTNSYDQWKTTTTDALSKVKDYVKDAYGNLVQVLEHNGSTYTTNYEYDWNKNLTKVTDAESNVRNFTYDGINRRLTAQDLHATGDGTYGSWSYSYDDAGNLTSQTDPKSQTVNFSYDDLSRLLTENYTGTGGTELAYAYDICTNGIGHMCTATSTDAVVAFTYNSLGLTTNETKTIGGTGFTTSYDYDRLKNTTLITYPDSSQVQYTYNNAGQLNSVAQKESGGSFASLVSNLDYSPTGKVALKQFANGVSSTYTYDAAHLYRLTNIYSIASSTEGGGGGGGGGLGFLGLNQYFADLDIPDFSLASSTSLEDSVFGDGLATSTDPMPETPMLPDEEASSTPPVIIPEETTPPADETKKDEQAVVPDTQPVPPVDDIATTTPDVIPEPPKNSLLATVSGIAIPKDGNIITKATGEVDDKGNAIYESQTYLHDVQYLDPITGERADINTALEDASDAWTMTKAPYSARLAKNLDDKAITYKSGNTELYFSVPDAETKAITAQKEEDKEQGEFVRYANAFGEGTDLDIAVNAGALIKNTLLESLDALKNFVEAEGNIEIPFTLDSNLPIDLVTEEGESLNKQGTITTGNLVHVVNDSGSSVAYIQPPVATDAKGNQTPIQIRYIKTEKGIEMTKLVPSDWLANAAFPIKTDATVTYYAYNGGMGALTKTSTNWNTARSASSAGYVYTADTASVGTDNNYNISRAAFTFDTSGLADNATVSAAALHVYATTGYNYNHDIFRIVQTSIASSTHLVADDYDQIGALTDPTSGGDTDMTSSWFSFNYLTFDLNSTGRGWINPTGWTKLGIREGHDYGNTASTGTDSVRLQFYSYGAGHDPYLTMTYTLPAPPAAPTSLLTEGSTNPTNITDYSPEFSSIYEDTDTGDVAPYYDIQVATSTSAWTYPVWDSGKTLLDTPATQGNRSIDISYGGSTLAANTTYYWRMKFWDQADGSGDWSTATSTFSIATTSAYVTPTYKSISTGSWTSAYTVSISKPSGLEVGDLMVAVIPVENNLGATPTGWKVITAGTSTPYYVGMGVYGKIADSSDVATSTFIFNGNDFMSGAILRIANASLNDIQSSMVNATWYEGINSFSPGVTPAREGSLLVSAFHESYRHGDYSAYAIASGTPTWTERVDENTTLSVDHMWSLATALYNSATSTAAFSVNSNAPGGTTGWSLLLSISGNGTPTKPTALLTEGQTNPTIVTDDTPEFSAIYNDIDSWDKAGSYEIQLATSTDFSSPFWDSTKTAVSATTTVGSRIPDVSYAGSALTRNTTYYWRIKTWDANGIASPWSDTNNFYFALSGTSNIIQDISYLYDAVGNITRITDISGTQAAKIVNYAYDDLYRLTSAITSVASSSPYTYTYTYSPIGNISSSTPSGAFTYAGTGYANPSAATSIGGTSLAYDNNGNLTTEGTKSYGWNFLNQMTTSGTGSATTTYGYDYSGQRVFKTASSTTKYPNQYFDTDGTTITKHVYAGGDLLADIQTVGATTTKQYMHADHLGSTNDVTDSTGAITQTLDYYPYGAPRISTGTFNEKRQYIGQQYDTESNLSYLNARYLDGVNGQFTSEDPSFLDIGSTGFESNYQRKLQQHLANPQALNSYAYGLNNPIINKDPDGEIIPLLVAGWAAAEIGLSAYDAYNAYQTVNDPNATQLQRNLALGGFVAGLYAPGGGYGTVGKSLVGQSFGKLGKVVENNAAKIAGFTEHGLNQVVNRGVTPNLLLETTRSATITLKQAGGNMLYLTNRAGVVLNKAGQVVTSYTSKDFKPYILNVLKQTK